MFIKSPLGQTYCVSELKSATEAIRFVTEKENLQEFDVKWRVIQSGRYLSHGEELREDGTLHVVAEGGLLGGKGGFGAQLRAIGAQIQKTTNHEAMRDLSGRRQRDVNNEQRMRDYAAKQAEREREEREKREAKMSKLKRLAERENKHDFHDPDYDKVRSETEEKVHDAMEAAMKVASDNKADLKRGLEDDDKEAATKEPKKKAKGTWLGDGLEGLSDEDLTDSEEENDPESSKAVAVN